MKVEREDIKKLKQADRIEYRQRYYRIYDYFSFDSTQLLILGWVMGAFALIMINLLNNFRLIDHPLRAAGAVVVTELIIYLVALLLTVLMRISRNKELEALEKEYFNTEVKAK